MKKTVFATLLASLTFTASTSAAKNVKVEAVGQFIDALDLEIFDARPGKGVVADNKHPGAHGTVCMQSLVVTNGSATKQDVQFDNFGKDGATLEQSAVEVIEPGESLNILDRGEAGDNIHVFRFDTKSLDAPRLIGKTGGDNCTPVEVTMFKAGSALSTKVADNSGPTILQFKQGNDTIVRFRVEIGGIDAGADSVTFTADLGAPLALGVGWGFPPD